MLTIQRYWSAAKARPVAFNSEQLHSMLQDYDAAKDRQWDSAWKLKMVLSFTVLTIIIGSYFLIQENATMESVVISNYRNNIQKKNNVDVHNRQRNVLSKNNSQSDNKATSLAFKKNNIFSTKKTANAISTVTLTHDELANIGIMFLPNGDVAYGYRYIVDPDCLPTGKLLTDSMISLCRRQDSISVDIIGASTMNANSMTLQPASLVHNNIVDDALVLITDNKGAIIHESVLLADTDIDKFQKIIQKHQQNIQSKDFLKEFNSLRGATQEYRQMQFATLLPILVESTSADGKKDSVIFWCRLNPNLLAKLPTKILNSLRYELSSVFYNQDEIVNVREWASRAIESVDSLINDRRHIIYGNQEDPSPGISSPLLGLYEESGTGIAMVKIFPNPTSGLAIIYYILPSSRRITIAVYDIRGNHSITVVDDVPQQAGKHAQVIPVQQLPEGIYQISISTEKNEQSLRRLIVVR